MMSRRSGMSGKPEDKRMAVMDAMNRTASRHDGFRSGQFLLPGLRVQADRRRD
jgi:hypothetical protein